jgi:hypothetical protein
LTTFTFKVEADWDVPTVVTPRPGRHIEQQKTLYMTRGESRLMSREWAAECEERNTQIVSSEWAATDGGQVTGESLSGTMVSAIFTPRAPRGRMRNTVTLSNGETLTAWWWVEVER